jgi:hypothetical protein
MGAALAAIESEGVRIDSLLQASARVATTVRTLGAAWAPPPLADAQTTVESAQLGLSHAGSQAAAARALGPEARAEVATLAAIAASSSAQALARRWARMPPLPLDWKLLLATVGAQLAAVEPMPLDEMCAPPPQPPPPQPQPPPSATPPPRAIAVARIRAARSACALVRAPPPHCSPAAVPRRLVPRALRTRSWSRRLCGLCGCARRLRAVDEELGHYAARPDSQQQPDLPHLVGERARARFGTRSSAAVAAPHAAPAPPL